MYIYLYQIVCFILNVVLNLCSNWGNQIIRTDAAVCKYLYKQTTRSDGTSVGIDYRISYSVPISHKLRV